MKKTFLTIISLLFLISCKAQTIGLEDMQSFEAGKYYKDINNTLNNFVGTYLYTNGNTSIEIKLQKKIASNRNNVFTEDLLIGGYRYVKDSVEIINTLNEINTFQSNGRVYPINGNNIMVGKYRCSTCDVNEKWLEISIDDPNYVYRMFVRKPTIAYGDNETISIFILPPLSLPIDDNSPNTPQIPAILPITQWITLLK